MAESIEQFRSRTPTWLSGNMPQIEPVQALLDLDAEESWPHITMSKPAPGRQIASIGGGTTVMARNVIGETRVELPA